MESSNDSVGTFYHGSPIPDLKVIEPKLDIRLGIKGVFVADEPFGPMMFSLLPIRAHAVVNYTTKDGKFIEGRVTTPRINKKGWLYSLEAENEIIKERKPGRFHLTETVKVIKKEEVLKEDVLKLGWKIDVKETK